MQEITPASPKTSKKSSLSPFLSGTVRLNADYLLKGDIFHKLAAITEIHRGSSDGVAKTGAFFLGGETLGTAPSMIKEVEKHETETPDKPRVSTVTDVVTKTADHYAGPKDFAKVLERSVPSTKGAQNE